jgi:lysophospholipase L1-like esterase
VRLERLAWLPALVLVYALAAEAGLQIAAYFVQRSTRAEMPVAWVTGNVRVLCLGDSNTYGIWVDRSQAYPQQLEAIWNQRIETPKLEVMNLGVPGTSSSRLVRELPGMLEAFDPDILIVLVGGNDFWTLPTPLEDAPATRPREGFLKRHSLLYKLYYLLQRGRRATAPEILLDPEARLTGAARHKVRVGDRELEMGFAAAQAGFEGDLAGLRSNLLRLVELARDAKRPLYLMTYPSQLNPYLTANVMIAAVAEETGTPLIKLASVIARECPEQACPDVLFPDGHPREKGYRLVAEAILERLAQSGFR